MQFGVFTLFDFFPDRQNERTHYQDTLDLMIYAEKLGFDSVWVGEEHFYSLGICPSPHLLLTALARETTGRYVDLGLLSIFPPALLANLPANDPLRDLWTRLGSMVE